MTTIYMRLGAFEIAQTKSTKSDKYQFKIVNNTTGKKTKHVFSAEQAHKLGRCYHINLKDYTTHSFSIFLYKKSLFGKKLIGRCDIPTYVLPMDKVTINYLPLINPEFNNTPAVLRLTLHLTQNTKPYRGEVVPSVLKQADVNDINFKLDLSSDDDNLVNSPLI